MNIKHQSLYILYKNMPESWSILYNIFSIVFQIFMTLCSPILFQCATLISREVVNISTSIILTPYKWLGVDRWCDTKLCPYWASRLCIKHYIMKSNVLFQTPVETQFSVTTYTAGQIKTCIIQILWPSHPFFTKHMN